jgi:hypothetical protein
MWQSRCRTGGLTWYGPWKWDVWEEACGREVGLGWKELAHKPERASAHCQIVPPNRCRGGLLHGTSIYIATWHQPSADIRHAQH